MTESAKSTQQRTCIACRATNTKRTLVRFVRNADGSVSLDPTGRAAGRGAYVCADSACFEEALKKRRLNANLKVNLSEENIAELKNQFLEFVNRPSSN